MQSREENSKQYFDTDIIGAAGSTVDDTDELFDRVSSIAKVYRSPIEVFLFWPIWLRPNAA